MRGSCRYRRAGDADDADRGAQLDEVATAENFARKNAMALRNTSVVNFFNLCAISLPVPREGGLPSGLMLIARNGHDQRLFCIAAAVEKFSA